MRRACLLLLVVMAVCAEPLQPSPANDGPGSVATHSAHGKLLIPHRPASPIPHDEGAKLHTQPIGLSLASQTAVECPNNCSSHGVCDNSVCTCDEGYLGTACALPDCSSVASCSGHGQCLSPGVCACAEQWGGADCTIDLPCVHNCSNHGHCLARVGACDCWPGWEGRLCDIHTPPRAELAGREWRRVFPPTAERVETDAEGNLFVVDSPGPPSGERPKPRHGHTLTSLPPGQDGVISGAILIGGEASGHTFRDVWKFERSSLTWTRMSQFEITPSPRSFHSAVFLGEVLYVYGGFDGLSSEIHKPLGDLWSLSPAGEWTNLPITTTVALSPSGSTSPPIPRAMHTAVAMGSSRDRMVVFGGVTGEREFTSEVWALHPGASRWESRAVAPFGGRVGHSATTSLDGNFMVVFGGQDASGLFHNDLWLYALGANTWISAAIGAQGPAARAHHSMVVHDGKMVVFGGQNADKRFDDMWLWDQLVGAWSLITPSPDNFHSPRSLALGGVALMGAGEMGVFGGYSGSHANTDTAELWLYSFAAHTWSRPITRGSVPAPRMLHAGAVVDGELVVFGGETAEGEVLRDLWVFSFLPNNPEHHMSWREVRPQWTHSPGTAAAAGGEVGEGELEADADVGVNSQGVRSTHGCTCQAESRNGDTGITHVGCSFNGYGNLTAWCDTIEACRYGEFWDFCDPEATQSNINEISTADTVALADGRMYLDLANWPTARAGAAVVSGRVTGRLSGLCGRRPNANSLVIYGGRLENSSLSDEIHVLCAGSGQWEGWSVGEFSQGGPGARSMSGIALSGDDLYIFGGLTEAKRRLNDVWVCAMVGGGGGGGGGGCREVLAGGWTPQKRRGMVIALEHPASCNYDCSTKEPEKLLMFGGYWAKNETAIPLEEGRHAMVPRRCVAVLPPFTDGFCDEICAKDPESSVCQSRCRCQKDFPMDIWQLSLNEHKWTVEHALSGPSPRLLPQAASHEGKWWMFGGLTLPSTDHNDLWFYDHARLKWVLLPPSQTSAVPSPRHEATFGVLARGSLSHLVVYGGIGQEGVFSDVWMCNVGDVIGR